VCNTRALSSLRASKVKTVLLCASITKIISAHFNGKAGRKVLFPTSDSALKCVRSQKKAHA